MIRHNSTCHADCSSARRRQTSQLVTVCCRVYSIGSRITLTTADNFVAPPRRVATGTRMTLLYCPRRRMRKLSGGYVASRSPLCSRRCKACFMVGPFATLTRTQIVHVSSNMQAADLGITPSHGRSSVWCRATPDAVPEVD